MSEASEVPQDGIIAGNSQENNLTLLEKNQTNPKKVLKMNPTLQEDLF